MTLLLVLAGLLARDVRHQRPAQFGILLALSLIAVLAMSVSHAGFSPPLWMRWVFTPVSSSTAIFIWWFSRSLFDDDFRLGPLEWGVAILWTVLGLFNLPDLIANREVSYFWSGTTRSIIAMGLVVHIIYLAIAGINTDLIEKRRRVRGIFACIIALLFLLDLMSEFAFGYQYTPIAFNIVQLSAFLAVIVWSVFWLGRIDPNVLTFDPKPDTPAPSKSSLSPKEQTMHDRLMTVMRDDKAYLDIDLSIGALASKVGVPEHQLRALINKSMGHRNFRSFLNEFRMADAKSALRDPDKAHLPILTIAMDSGFASLASFNRLFKTATGTTPTAYRNRETPPQNTPQN